MPDRNEARVSELIHDLALQIVRGDLSLRERAAWQVGRWHYNPRLLVAHRMHGELHLAINVDRSGGVFRLFLRRQVWTAVRLDISITIEPTLDTGSPRPALLTLVPPRLLAHPGRPGRLVLRLGADRFLWVDFSDDALRTAFDRQDQAAPRSAADFKGC